MFRATFFRFRFRFVAVSSAAILTLALGACQTVPRAVPVAQDRMANHGMPSGPGPVGLGGGVGIPSGATGAPGMPPYTDRAGAPVPVIPTLVPPGGAPLAASTLTGNGDAPMMNGAPGVNGSAMDDGTVMVGSDLPLGNGSAPPTGPGAAAGTAARIGLLLPLSGPSAATGEAMLHSAELALFEAGDTSAVMQVYDTHGTADGAARAVDIALSQGVRLIVGPLFSGAVKAVGPKARAAGVSVISFSTDPGAAMPGVYVIGHQQRQQVQRVIQFARSQGLMTFAVLAPSDEQGRLAVQTAREVATATGGTIKAVELYDPAATDLTPVVKRLAAQKPFDAILIPDKGSRVKTVAPLLPYYDIDVPRTRLLGTLRWAETDFGGEPAMVGSWYATPRSPAQQAFVERYRQAFGGNPPAISTLSYDAMALAAALARQAGGTGFDPALLNAETGFAGIDGIFRLLPQGVTERGLAVLEIGSDGRPFETSPAPQTFEKTVY